MPPKKRKRNSKKKSRFPWLRSWVLVSVILLTGLTLLLALRLPIRSLPDESSSLPPKAELPTSDNRSRSGSTPSLEPQQPVVVDPAKPQLEKEPTSGSQPLVYESVSRDFEAQVREVDLAILSALESVDQNTKSLRHRAVEARQFQGQEFFYQNLTLELRQDIFPFLAALEQYLVRLAPGSSLQALDGNPRDLEISIQGQPTHHLFIPLTITPTQVEPSTTSPRLVIIIDDLGESTKTAHRLARLPFPVSFSVLPFTTHAREVAGIARQNNRELLLHLPCEPLAYPKVDSGPGTLRVSMTPAQLEQTLVSNLARLPEVDGVNNHMGSKLTQEPQAMHVILAHLKGRGKFFIDSLTTPKSCVATVSAKLGLQYRRRHIFLDNTAQKQAILLQLKKAEALALKNGLAVAIGHPYPETLAALEAWSATQNKQIIICKAQDI